MGRSKVLSLIGLATKAGKTASGEFCTEREVKSGGAALVIIADDASDNTKKMFSNMCAFYEVPRCICGTKEELGTAVGKAMRASLAVTDENFARAISKRLEQAGKQIDNNANSHLERV